ncbi:MULTISPECIES: efflux RND transporter periplasmic adaptor subunit [Pseudoalteromonas]|uniref:Efflux RND transporter periplasmic adaptor subunit n=1 Tax=Pseudoalteromonas obscura TaxID=3048491 RepID=A0ABT7ERU3_9GAMM|nr:MULTISPECIES: efflux RND transporter periplasmic adaptor subunit [Pseudoalteromonas]MBQ4839046.1 efflux RND transporter periplasmic adaptor subunit [Pseudoalteromonas luteoviolacea]MDK2597784.1 efflux RND transporter periplasmic adaptor subunit [Pseudoalteromonas sp. P94(2023)]
MFISFNAYAEKQVMVAEVKDWQQGATIPLWCHARALHKFHITSHSEAQLKWIKPRGSYVEQGEVIALQDAYYLAKQKELLELDLQTAKLTFQLEQSEYQRLQDLSRDHTSEQQLMLRANKVKAAQLAKHRLKSQLSVISHKIEKLSHTAPISGQIIQIDAQPGQFLSQGELLAIIEPQQAQELSCDMPMHAYQAIGGGQGLKLATFNAVGLSAMHFLRGSKISSENKQVVNFILGYDMTPEVGLLVGESKKVHISMEQENLTQIPHDALQIDSANQFVWRLTNGVRVERIKAEVVYHLRDQVVVRSALKVGEKVVTVGKQGLNEQDLVEVSEWNAGALTQAQREIDQL